MSEDFVTMNITSKMRDGASNKSKELGVLKHSIAKGKGNMYGYLGEAMFKR
jgi:hypothetical protein